MSVRGAEDAGATGSGASGATERRVGAAQRVHFEALVAVGGTAGGAGFEAESVDMSPDGMRLRTAYLPEIGDRLACRFDGMGVEVAAEGEVIWRSEEARGGEFGLRFFGLDSAAAEAIRSMCASLGSEPAPGADEAGVALRGARVRLHIEGLGSPMKARVRDSNAKEVEVGSNLEFLRVGRSLEVEDCDKGGKREATIEHVKVDMDPTTNVPQLVVSLRYQVSADASSVRAPSKRPSGSVPPPRKDERASEPAPAREETRKSADPGGRKRVSEAQAEAPAIRVADTESDPSDAPPGVGARAAKAGREAAGKIGPALAGMGAKAKGAMSGLVAAVRQRRADRAESEEASAAPRRTTAPPPGGALKSEGRRLVRDGDSSSSSVSDDDDALAPPPRTNRRAAGIGAAVGLVAVLGVFGAARALHAKNVATAATDGSTASALTSASPAASAASATDLAANTASGTTTANVPLFGTTPLSTTEPVPATPPPSDSALAAAGSPPPNGEDAETPGASSDTGGPGHKEWGQGTVTHPVVLKIKMDGPIERINGASGAMGFTISLPNRRSVGSAADLAHKDKRLASVNVVNSSHGAEVTVQFKDGVPPYLARVKGDHLEIALGAEHKKVAKKKGGDKAKGKGHKKHGQ